MKPTRTLRLATALLVLISMLFAQLAVAAYACPSLNPAFMAQSQVHEGMDGCTGMDKQQPNLCQAHDQIGKQSLDKPDLPLVPPFVAAAMVAVLDHVISTANPPQPAIDLSLATATAPPHAIQHCCFRI